MRLINFEIKNEYDGVQIRDFLRNFGVSSALLTRLKQTENGICLNGKFAKAIEPIHTGDTLTIKIESKGTPPSELHTDKVKLIYEDEDVLILDKPPFMPIHESRNHRGDTLANAAACYISGGAFRAVFRLDRDTSGLVLIAKNELAACKLAGKVDKDYYAVCKGIMEGEGTIDLPIRRVKESIIERGVFDDGERAVTHWKAVKSSNGRTLLRLKLETGRTHQIRVHMSHLGHPLLGDSLYGGDCADIDRQALHCGEIRFTHPVSSKRLCFSSELPRDIQTLI